MGKVSKDHITALQDENNYHKPGKDNGCVTRCIWKKVNKKWTCQIKGHSYRDNCFDYTNSKPSEKLWYNVDFRNNPVAKKKYDNAFGARPIKQKWRDPTQQGNENVWWLNGGKYAYLNFKNGKWPWFNNAHHIIPIGSLHSQFEYSELRILQMAKYNVNRGVNVMFLPQGVRQGEAYELPVHPNKDFHPDYNTKVQLKLDTIVKKINKAKDEENDGHSELSEETAPNVSKELEKFSERMRPILKSYGISNPAGRLDSAPVR